MGTTGAAARTISHSTGRLRRSLGAAAEASAPRGRVLRLRLRVTLDLLVTLAMVTFAAVATTAYQVVRWRNQRTRGT